MALHWPPPLQNSFCSVLGVNQACGKSSSSAVPKAGTKPPCHAQGDGSRLSVGCVVDQGETPTTGERGMTSPLQHTSQKHLPVLWVPSGGV